MERDAANGTIQLILVRHGYTDWNVEKRIQGRTDTALSASGAEQIKQRQLPPALANLPWYCSPLLRARQTAQLMRIANPTIDERLTEMNWGDWEGHILKLLRKKIGQPMRDSEARGLDFRPPNGESPRDVQKRLLAWTQAIAQRNTDCAAIVHKGIIRCAYALAHNWDMRGESPIQFNWQGAHAFVVDRQGRFLQRYDTIALTSRV